MAVDLNFNHGDASADEDIFIHF